MLRDSADITERTLRADICIIGCGAAGITIAKEFIGTRYRVIVLEGGGLSFEPASQEPYRSEVGALPHNGIHEGRARATGGTTLLWAGQCLPLLEQDFAVREWVPLSGWPIAREELSPFYERAQRVMQVPPATYEPSSWPNAYPPQLGSESDVKTYYSQFASQPNFWIKYGAELRNARNLDVITHANVTNLQASLQADAVTSVQVRGPGERKFEVSATFLIICCGGIETARLLLVSDSVEKNGIGNRHDVVGRYFQDHFGVVFPVKVHKPREFNAQYNGFFKGSIRHAVKLAASETLQQREKILHVGGEIFYPVSETDPITAAKTIVKSIRMPHLRREVSAAMRTVLAM